MIETAICSYCDQPLTHGFIIRFAEQAYHSDCYAQYLKDEAEVINV